VLALHEGWHIEQGWSFYVFRPDSIELRDLLGTAVDAAL